MTDPTTAIERLSTYAGIFEPGADELADDVRAVLGLLTPGVLQIALERRRQITDEHFTPEQDRGHAPSLFDAAGEYATAASTAALLPNRGAELPVPFGWPWEAGFWKPVADPIKNARRSAALLAAGIDALLAEQDDNTPTKES